ncbi:hypothetical protein KR018_004341 [Drosophila ironensis]|nr:hypothetical protein KR018_004341 [Drosophila ironensis]
MCDYRREYTFVFEDSSCDGDVSMISHDRDGFESLWRQISEELRREHEIDELGQVFQQNLSLSPTVYGEQWNF